MTCKLQVKIYAQEDVELEDYVPVFHRWIRDRRLTDLLIDVVDYRHVSNGPAVVLIGHESDYVLDRSDGRLGLLFANKRGTLLTVSDALSRAVEVARVLENESDPNARIAFRGDELMFRIADRLNAPNTEATYQRFLPELRDAIGLCLGSGAVLAQVGTDRELFTVQARAIVPVSFQELCQRIPVRPPA